MLRTALPLAAACLAFAGCNSQSNEPAPENGDDKTASRTPPVPEPSGFASTYTDLELAKCEVLEENREEGSWARYRCPGFGDIPLLVQEGDGRFDLDAGIDDDDFQTLGAFNDIGDTVEWRLDAGKPFAVIFRFIDVAGETPDRTVLAVETVGREGALGCRLAQLSGDTPDANQRARDAADAAAADGFACPEEPEFTGNAR